MDDLPTNFPKFQYSAFLGTNRDEQFVIRAESFEEFKQLKKELDLILNTKSSRNSEPNSNANGYMKCMKCGGEAELREGVSKKTNKPYKGVFCFSRSCNYAQFL